MPCPEGWYILPPDSVFKAGDKSCTLLDATRYINDYWDISSSCYGKYISNYPREQPIRKINLTPQGNEIYF